MIKLNYIKTKDIEPRSRSKNIGLSEALIKQKNRGLTQLNPETVNVYLYEGTNGAKISLVFPVDLNSLEAKVFETGAPIVESFDRKLTYERVDDSTYASRFGDPVRHLVYRKKEK